MDKMSNGLVSIVIVTARAANYLKALLDSVNRQSLSPFETIIVDNSAGTNLFYCSALNKGIRESKGEFVLCLNDDVVLDGDFLKNAVKGFAVSPSIGMVSAKVLRSDGKLIDTAGLSLSIWLTAEDRGYSSRKIEKFNTPGFVFGVNGAAAFYRRLMLEDIKIGSDYFDEDYRIFYEDLDISWRAQNFGWKGYFVAEAVAYHARGGTVRSQGGTAQPFARRYLSDELHLRLIRNRHSTIIKNAPLTQIFFHLPFIILYDFAALIFIIFLRRSMLKKLFLAPGFLKSAFIKRKMLKNILRERFSRR